MGFHVKYPKPRRAKGTRFFRLRNYYALGTLAVCSALGYFIHISPIGQSLNEDIKAGKFNVSEEEKERRLFMSFSLAPKTAEQIIKNQEEQEKFATTVRKLT